MSKIRSIQLHIEIIWRAILGKPLIVNVHFMPKTTMFFAKDGNVLVANCEFEEIMPIWEDNKLSGMLWAHGR